MWKKKERKKWKGNNESKGKVRNESDRKREWKKELLESQNFVFKQKKNVYYLKPFIIFIFTQPLRSGRIWHKVNFFKRSLTGLNSEFSFS